MQASEPSWRGPVHIKVADAIDRAMTIGANFLGWCGKNGKRGGLSVRFADLFWVECNCCNFYRGVTVGMVGLALLQVLVYVMSLAVISAFGLGIVAALAVVKAIEPAQSIPTAPQSEFEIHS